MNRRDSRDPLDGFQKASYRDEEVQHEKAETIYDLIAIEVKETIRQKSATEEFKRSTAKTIVTVTLIALAGFLLLGSFTSDYSAAALWWHFVGPIVGFMSHSIFGGRGP